MNPSSTSSSSSVPSVVGAIPAPPQQQRQTTSSSVSNDKTTNTNKTSSISTSAPPAPPYRPPSTTPSTVAISKPSIVSYGPLKFLITDSPRDSNLHLYIKEMKKANVTHLVRVSSPTYDPRDLGPAGIQIHDLYYPDGTSPPKHVIDRWLDIVERTFFTKGKTAGQGGIVGGNCKHENTAAAAQGECQSPAPPTTSNDNVDDRDDVTSSLVSSHNSSQDNVNNNAIAGACQTTTAAAATTASSSAAVNATQGVTSQSQSNTTATIQTPTGASCTPPCVACHCVAGLGRAPVLVAIALIEFTDLTPLKAVQFIRSRRRGAVNSRQLGWIEGYRKRRKKGCVVM